MSRPRPGSSFRERLLRSAEGVSWEGFPPDLLPRLEELDEILLRFAASLDLAGFKTEEERLCRYFGEVLAAARWLPERGAAVDVGSGGGSPGLPLALARPGLRWLLVESRRKKALFLEEAIRALGLVDVEVANERFERVDLPDDLAIVCTRGVAPTPAMLRRIEAGLRAGGRFLWFGGEEKLREAALYWRTRAEFRVEGPERLVKSSQGRLLVVEKRD